MTEKLLCIIGERYPITLIPDSCVECLRASGMKFNIRAYHAEGLGHVSVMSAKGFFGLMKMDTLIVNLIFRSIPTTAFSLWATIRS